MSRLHLLQCYSVLTDREAVVAPGTTTMYPSQAYLGVTVTVAVPVTTTHSTLQAHPSPRISSLERRLPGPTLCTSPLRRRPPPPAITRQPSRRLGRCPSEKRVLPHRLALTPAAYGRSRRAATQRALALLTLRTARGLRRCTLHTTATATRWPHRARQTGHYHPAALVGTRDRRASSLLRP